MKVFDAFPFFNELDVLEIRLHELDPVVDRFIILESKETYGGQPKPLHLRENWDRFSKFHKKIEILTLPRLEPACTDRVSGRLREAYQRNQIWPALDTLASSEDVVIFSDCDEIPRGLAVDAYLLSGDRSIRRLKQNSYYYSVNNLVDYGHDFASRARLGSWAEVQKNCATMYDFRMYQKNTCTAIECGGWHFGYFGGPKQIYTKVAASSPFLSEYKLFGAQQLTADVLTGTDLHHRRCELPERFEKRASDDPTLPQYYLENRRRFHHFTDDWWRGK